jgi:hypothetical protein
VLLRRLSAGLDRQVDVKLELIALDNRAGRFSSATAALEEGAAAARGEWLLFAHQDVELLSPRWLVCAVAELEPLVDLGWAGVAGADAQARFRGLLVDGGMVRGEYRPLPVPVETLDECLLMTRRRDGRYFDSNLSGWHAYGVDACLDALAAGRCNVVLSRPVWHDSPATNLQGLQQSRAWIWAKHRARFATIHTTTGSLPERIAHPDGERAGLGARVARRARATVLAWRGWQDPYAEWLGDRLEAETGRDDHVDVFRTPAPVEPLHARGFVHQPRPARSVVHRFGGSATDARRDARRVVWYDRIAGAADPVADVAALTEERSGSWVVAPLGALRPGLGLARWLGARARVRTLVRDPDGGRLALFQLR